MEEIWHTCCVLSKNLNTLIWECEFPTLQAVQDALDLLARDPRHAALFQQQVQFFEESFVEIYQAFDGK